MSQEHVEPAHDRVEPVSGPALPDGDGLFNRASRAVDEVLGFDPFGKDGATTPASEIRLKRPAVGARRRAPVELGLEGEPRVAAWACDLNRAILVYDLAHATHYPIPTRSVHQPYVGQSRKIKFVRKPDPAYNVRCSALRPNLRGGVPPRPEGGPAVALPQARH